MQELINLVNQLIIDNNTNQVTPAKLRQVLIALINQMYSAGGGGVLTITASDPLNFDGFTGDLRLLPIPFGEMRWLGYGYKWAADPSEESANLPGPNPVAGAFCIGSDFDGNFLISRWNGEGNIKDPVNHIIGASWRMRAPEGETQEEA